MLNPKYVNKDQDRITYKWSHFKANIKIKIALESCVYNYP